MTTSVVLLGDTTGSFNYVGNPLRVDNWWGFSSGFYSLQIVVHNFTGRLWIEGSLAAEPKDFWDHPDYARNYPYDIHHHHDHYEQREHDHEYRDYHDHYQNPDLQHGIEYHSDWFPINLNGNIPYLSFPQNPNAPTGEMLESTMSFEDINMPPTFGDTSNLVYSFQANLIWLRARVDRHYLIPYPPNELNVQLYGNIRKVLVGY